MEPDSGPTIAWRMQQAEAYIARLDAEKADVKDMARLTDEVQALKRMGFWLVGALVTATITFGVWALQLATTHG